MVIGISEMANADITIEMPKDCGPSSVHYYYAPINKFANAKTRADRGLVADSVMVKDAKAVISFPNQTENYLVGLNVDNNNISVYVSPGENVNLNVTSCNPFAYSLSGSPLANGMNELITLNAPLEAKAQEMIASGNQEGLSDLGEQFTQNQKNFISNNPENPAVPVALMNLDGEDFISIYESLPDSQKSSILYPLLTQQYEREKKSLEMDKKQKALQSGEVEAPNFTLKDLEGKDMSLSDFRGKWVILDFWGSWCPWCIKGFPELKEAYQKYQGKLEIIGVDCRESEADWKAGVEKYQLPWVNVYNPEGSSLLSEYGVQGFPTKAIIDPQGKIRNITVGHDPAFFVALTELMGE